MKNHIILNWKQNYKNQKNLLKFKKKKILNWKQSY